MKKRIVIADDHELIVSALSSIITKNTNHCIAGIAHNGSDAIKLVTSLNPDVLITDLHMPQIDGLQLIKRVSLKNPNVRIIVISMHNSEMIMQSAIEAGAHGYLSKDLAHSELINCLNSVLCGEQYYPGINTSHKEFKKGLFSKREKQIAFMLVNGNSTSEIANKLSISAPTVSTHKSNIFKKSRVKNLTEFLSISEYLGLKPN